MTLVIMPDIKFVSKIFSRSGPSQGSFIGSNANNEAYGQSRMVVCSRNYSISLKLLMVVWVFMSWPLMYPIFLSLIR